MPPNEKQAKLYYTVGKIVVNIARWLFYIGLLVLAFKLGEKQGSLIERFRQLEFPRIRIIRLPGSSGTAPPPSTAAVAYYAVVVGSYSSREEGELLQVRLREQRIHSYILPQGDSYLVCVGKYRSPKQAQYALQQVQARGFPEAKLLSPSS